MASVPAARSRDAFAGLAALADPVLFEVQYDAVVAAIAERFSLQADYTIAELQGGYRTWISRCAGTAGGRDERHFVTIVALLIESLATRQAVRYALTAWPSARRDR